MLRSLFSGISGLKAHQEMMDVVANNIANVNTVGYKSSNAIFEDTLSQLMRGAAAATPTNAGLNPTQIGLGVQLAAVQSNFTQGATQTTNNATDLIINGDGFFVLDNAGQQVYSRAGDFKLDADGYLVNSDGMYVKGYSATNGVVDSLGVLTRIKLPSGYSVPGSATTAITLGGNLSPTGTQPLISSADVYDVNGAHSALPITFTPHNPPDGGYDITVTDPANPATTVGTGNIAFTPAGAFDPAASTNPVVVTIGTQTINVDISGMTGYAGDSSPTVTKSDGYQFGILNQFQIGPDGIVLGIFSNSQKLDLGQVALATFNNTSGLQKLGDSTFLTTANSGLAEVGTPGSGGRGLMTAGALEMSNVDLGAEFTNMIIAQRGFTANSKVITASDEMLQDLVNMKR